MRNLQPRLTLLVTGVLSKITVKCCSKNAADNNSRNASHLSAGVSLKRFEKGIPHTTSGSLHAEPDIRLSPRQGAVLGAMTTIKIIYGQGIAIKPTQRK